MNTSRVRLADAALGGLLATVCATAAADTHTATAPTTAPKSAVSAASSLDFALTLDRFVSLSVGSNGAAVGFNLSSLAAPQCSGSPLPVCFGNGTPVAAAANGVLPVTVRSNAGAVKLMASVKTPLTSEQGAETIPMSQIKISSSDAANLPAPQVPNSGNGVAVNVAPSDFGGRVTQRSAQWTFSFANTVSPTAGVYHGKIVFTATLP
jgi:hypothetical protein